jgi:membrane-associated protease RseP (regulator of RpoE activity)
MKTTLLLLATLAASLPGLAEEKKSSASSSVTVNSTGEGTGKATITIEVNGKKEVREIDLGNATEIRIESTADAKARPARRTYLGVTPDDLPEEVAAQLPLGVGEGVLVRSIVPDSPAAAAGLKKNDVLVRLDDQILTDGKQLQKLVSAKKAGETVRLVYFRGGQKNDVEVKLAEQDATKPETLFFNHDWNFDKLHDRLLKIDKKAVVIDRDGNVITKAPEPGDWVKNYEAAIRQALPAEQIKKLQTQLEAMRKQVEAAQKQAAEAIEQAAKAAQKAAEAMKREDAPLEKK